MKSIANIFDRYSFLFCEKNRILFIFFSNGEYFPEKSKGKNPHGEGHNFPRGFVFPAGIWTFTAKYFLSA